MFYHEHAINSNTNDYLFHNHTIALTFANASYKHNVEQDLPEYVRFVPFQRGSRHPCSI